MKKEIISRVKYILSVIVGWDSKFKAKIILAIGFLFIGYLYALGHRYQTAKYNEGSYILDSWTGKLYTYFGREESKLGYDKKLIKPYYINKEEKDE